MNFLLLFLVSAACGVIAGFGIGGGTLLVVCMTLFLGVEQRDAQAVNLLFFIAMSPFALYGHVRNKLVEMKCVLYAVPAGVVSAALVSYFAQAFDPTFLRRMFGILLLYVGVKELFAKNPKPSQEKSAA